MQARAQGWIVPDPRGSITKVSSTVDVRIEGRVAHVTVEEWFRNDGGAFGEADYLFPLPGEAVFESYSLYQGDDELRGEMLDAARAREIYEAIVRSKRDPALIELVGHGLVRARVFPFAAGEARRITLRYTQLLERTGDALQFRYAAGRRHGGWFGPVPVERGTVSSAGDGAFRFTLAVEDARQYGDAFSLTHALDVSREGRRMIVRPRGELTGELAVFLPISARAVGLTLVAHRPSGEDGYFMLTLTPHQVPATRVPRDLTAVIDVSGSMSGEKMEQTRRALVQLLGTLDEGDRFRLITFSSGITVYRPDWTTAARDELAAARRWVEGLRAGGGTNIAGALEEAFRLSSPAERLPFLVFMTDGLPTVGERSPERIVRLAERLRGEARIFAFGVGYDVNTALLDALSVAGRGSTQYVRPAEDVEIAIGTLAAKISHPVLADLRIDGAPVRLSDIYPVVLPDLFAGQDLVIFGRYAAGSRDVAGELAVAGRRATQGGSGRERYTTSASFPAHALANDYISRIWASRKLGELARLIRTNGADPELVEELRATALRYGLLSEYTSYLVQEPEALVAQRGDPPRRLVPRTAWDRAVSLREIDVTGARAVEAADASRRARDVRSLAELDAAQHEAASAAGVPRPAAGARSEAGANVRLVAGRYFELSDGVWVDTGTDGAERVLHVEAYSEAYFGLLAALPELRPVLAELEHVQLAGARATLRIAPGGLSALSPSHLIEFVRAFRHSP